MRRRVTGTVRDRKQGPAARVRLAASTWSDATDLGRIESAFGLVVCTWMLSHLDAPAETVRCATRKLAPGGTAIFVFFSPPENAFLRRLLRALGGPFHYRFVDPTLIGELPHLEQLSAYAGGMATLAVLNAPPPA